jgi:N-acetyl-gamma-glutamyl-phosphate reductase
VLSAGIVGATGYTGIELVGLIEVHPGAQLAFAASSSHAGETLGRVAPGAPEIKLVSSGDLHLEGVDVLFLCLPHGASAEYAERALSAGVRVIDLSADFRLREEGLYPQWYGAEHRAPWLLDQAVYGLTEIYRAELAGAKLVANPGCYPTSVLLGLHPLFRAGLVPAWIIVDAKSGVSGAGRKPKQSTHFVEVAGNLKPYKVGRVHRHVPEMEQILADWSDPPPPLTFVPHLVPAPRGLLSTIYVPLSGSWSERRVRAAYEEIYEGEPFLLLLPPGEAATLAHVNYSNRCAIGWTLSEGALVITAAIDNLLKGASGQAVQNMNVMFGLEETVGLGNWP